MRYYQLKIFYLYSLQYTKSNLVKADWVNGSESDSFPI